jgi:hypothetical protein
MMRYRPLVTPSSQPQPRPFPSGRYARTDPLRRLFGLQLLAEPLPEPLRPILIWAWMHPGRYNGNQAIPTRERQRLPDNVLLDLPPTRLCGYTQIELEVGRRIVELPRTEITREMRNWLLRAQATYLAALYAALVKQLGEAQAQAEFTRRIRALR